MSSSLELISHRIIKVMNLPEFFTKPLPLSTLLDTPIKLSQFIGHTKKRKTRAKSSSRESGRESGREQEKASPPRLVTVSGKLSDGKTARFSIADQDFQVLTTTWVIGDIKMGGVARIKGRLNSSGMLEASSVVMLEQS